MKHATPRQSKPVDLERDADGLLTPESVRKLAQRVWHAEDANERRVPVVGDDDDTGPARPPSPEILATIAAERARMRAQVAELEAATAQETSAPPASPATATMPVAPTPVTSATTPPRPPICTLAAAYREHAANIAGALATDTPNASPAERLLHQFAAEGSALGLAVQHAQGQLAARMLEFEGGARELLAIARAMRELVVLGGALQRQVAGVLSTASSLRATRELLRGRAS